MNKWIVLFFGFLLGLVPSFAVTLSQIGVASMRGQAAIIASCANTQLAIVPPYVIECQVHRLEELRQAQPQSGDQL